MYEPTTQISFFQQYGCLLNFYTENDKIFPFTKSDWDLVESVRIFAKKESSVASAKVHL
jgi:hypothetical protein